MHIWQQEGAGGHIDFGGVGIMNDEKNKPLLVPLSDVQEKTAEWLVPGYMPRGQINIWAGDGGSGKTTAGRREVYN